MSDNIHETKVVSLAWGEGVRVETPHGTVIVNSYDNYALIHADNATVGHTVVLGNSPAPINPPPAQPDDERVQAIHNNLEALELIEKIKRERLDFPANSVERRAHGQLQIVGSEELLEDANFKPVADIRYLLDRFDAVTRALDAVISDCETSLAAPEAHRGNYTYVEYRGYEDVLDILEEHGLYTYPTSKETDHADE